MSLQDKTKSINEHYQTTSYGTVKNVDLIARSSSYEAL